MVLEEKLGPSHVHSIDECNLRYAFRKENSENTGYIALYDRNTFLGNVIHEVINTYISEKRHINDFDIIWSQTLRELKNGTLNSPNIEAIKYEAPFYVIKKWQTKDLLTGINDSNSRFYSEYPFESIHLKGKIDLVKMDHESKSVEIIDFKSGPIWSYVDGKKHQPIQKYITQILSYGLYFFENGFAPSNITCKLIGLSKNDYYQINFNTEDYRKYSNHLFKLRRRLGQMMEKENFNIPYFGKPSPENCCYCSFRYKCRAFLKEIQVNPKSYQTDIFLNLRMDDLTIEANKIRIVLQNNRQLLIHNVPSDIIRSLNLPLIEADIMLLTGLLKGDKENNYYWLKTTQKNMLTNI
jgi:hypothetical protein